MDDIDDAQQVRFNFEEDNRSNEQRSGRRGRGRNDVVCKYWIRGLCMDVSNCRFLHEYDELKLPLCRYGMSCRTKDCIYRHVEEIEREECQFFLQGFCRNGPACRFRHVKFPLEDRPRVAAAFECAGIISDKNAAPQQHAPVQVKQQPTIRDKSLNTGSRLPMEMYKVQICKHWQSGSCPFGAECRFAHGEDELRRPGDPIEPVSTAGALPPDGIPDAAYLLAARAQNPALPDANCTAIYIIAKSKRMELLILSLQRKTWFCHQSQVPLIASALARRERVFLFFSVWNSCTFQGVATVQSVRSGDTFGPAREFVRLGVRWERLVDLPFGATRKLLIKSTPPLLIAHATDFSQLDPDAGRALMQLMWQQPELEVATDGVEVPPEFDPITSIDHASMGAEFVGDDIPPALHMGPNMSMDHAIRDLARHWASGGDGYVFATSAAGMVDSLKYGVFGVKHQHEESCAFIRAGTPLLALQVSDKIVLGLFVARGPPQRELVPDAFAGRDGRSQYPVQVPATIAVECPPVSEIDLGRAHGLNVHLGRVDARSMESLAQGLLRSVPPPLLLRAHAALGVPSAGR